MNWPQNIIHVFVTLKVKSKTLKVEIKKSAKSHDVSSSAKYPKEYS